MKKILTIFCSLLVAIQIFAKTPVETFAETVNARAPYEMTEGLKVIKAEAGKEGLVVTYDITDEFFASLDFISDMLHDSLIAELQTSDKERTAALRDYLKANNIPVIHRMKNSAGDTHDIVIKPTEL